MTEARARKVLGVRSNASPVNLKKAFRRRALATHPDRGGSSEAFQEVDKAYKILTGEPIAEPVVDDAPISMGHWFTVREVWLDSLRVPEESCRAQLATVKQEILICLYFSPSWPHSSAELKIVLSERSEDREVALYKRKILQRSSDRKGLTAAWFSPFQKRMRLDGYEVGQEPEVNEVDPRFRPKR